MIGAELTSAMGSSSRPSSTSSRTQPFPPIQPLDPGKLRELSARLTTVESRLPQAPAEVERLRGQLLKKEKELEDIDKLLNDCVAENDVMFERFNEELVKMANGFRLGHREAELLEMLQQVRGELGSLKAENM